MQQKSDTKQRILEAAQKEFAAHGFSGARMERIAQTARINKAMIFYYYSSKRSLYRTLIKTALTDLIPRIQQAFLSSRDPEDFFDKFPDIYIRHFSRNPEFVQMIGFEVIRAPENIAPLIQEIFSEYSVSPAQMLPKIVGDWYERGLITESDPKDFILNIISLCLFSIIAAPMVKAILDRDVEDYDAYIERRIRSIANLLKRGMLK